MPEENERYTLEKYIETIGVTTGGSPLSRFL